MQFSHLVIELNEVKLKKKNNQDNDKYVLKIFDKKKNKPCKIHYMTLIEEFPNAKHHSILNHCL